MKKLILLLILALLPIGNAGVIHVEGPRPAAANSSVTVVGAGSGEVDGLYTRRGTLNGKDYYNLTGQPDDSVRNSISWSGTVWSINDASASPFYTSTNNVAQPWLVTTWVAIVGDPPVPTVNETP